MDGATLCAQVVESASAQLDDEEGVVSAATVTTHVAGCRDCARDIAALSSVHRMVRVTPAEDVPNLVPAVMDAVRSDTPRRRLRQRRVVLGLTGVATALPGVLALLAGVALHASREVAVFEVAVGLVVLATAVRPRQLTAGVAPLAAIVAALVTVTAVHDVAVGTTTLVAESAHLPLVLTPWLLLPWMRGAAGRHKPRADRQATA